MPETVLARNKQRQRAGIRQATGRTRRQIRAASAAGNTTEVTRLQNRLARQQGTRRRFNERSTTVGLSRARRARAEANPRIQGATSTARGRGSRAVQSVLPRGNGRRRQTSARELAGRGSVARLQAAATPRRRRRRRS